MQPGDVVWHGIEVGKPDFTSTSRTLALVLDGSRTGREPDADFYMAFNAWKEALPFAVPPPPQGRCWRRVIDTALPPPLDVVPRDEGPVIADGSRYTVAPFSLLVLIGERHG